MEKYEQIINFMKESKLDMTRLYIYDTVRVLLPKEEHKAAVEYVYDVWLDFDNDLTLSRLTDVVCEKWVEIKNDEIKQDDIIDELF